MLLPLRRFASLTLCHVLDEFDDDREYRRPHHESLFVRLQKELLALAESVGGCVSSASQLLVLLTTSSHWLGSRMLSKASPNCSLQTTKMKS